MCPTVCLILTTFVTNSQLLGEIVTGRQIFLISRLTLDAYSLQACCCEDVSFISDCISTLAKLPKNYNPDVTPDPERWLPRKERSYYRGKRKDKKKDIGMN